LPVKKVTAQYRYCHGSKNFRGKNVLRAVKQLVKRTSFTPDVPHPQLENLLDLTRQKVLLDFVGGLSEVDKEAVR
jgi:hypothetical protein